MPLAHLGLGSNIGNSQDILRQALRAIEQQIGRITASSSLYQTEPVGYKEWPEFVNAVVAVDISLAPRALLSTCISIEEAFGRQRQDQKKLRTLDIDLLLYGERVIAEEGLSVPHPEMHRRRFVLEPLVEIDPLRHHPVLRKTVQDLLALCAGAERVVRIRDAWWPERVYKRGL